MGKSEPAEDDLFCYGMMLSTFFTGCLIMPMTGIFTSMANGETNMGCDEIAA